MIAGQKVDNKKSICEFILEDSKPIPVFIWKAIQTEASVSVCGRLQKADDQTQIKILFNVKTLKLFKQVGNANPPNSLIPSD